MALSCPNCGKALPDDAKFCGDCGTTVVAQEKKPDYCANCFAELPENVKFCLQCGKPAVIAQANYPQPERDKAIYDELYATSPQYVRYLEHKAIAEATGTYPPTGEEIEDFEQNKAKLAWRARKWAEHDTSNKAERIHWFQELHNFRHITWRIPFDIEQMWFPTNKPNHHKALFYEEFINHHLFELRQHGVLTWYDPPQLTPLFYDYMRKVEGWTDEDLEEFKLRPPDMEEIRGWAAKDDELFPPPQPLRVEVAGAFLNFTTDEAVLVVYVDCSHKGKTLAIKNLSEPIRFIDYPDTDRKAEIIERTSGNTALCAAIFNHIPFVTNELRHSEKVLTQMNCTVEADSFRGFPHRWEETVTLYRGKVVDLDWRGRK